jgi:putative ABC transport system ATP-binding protein
MLLELDNICRTYGEGGLAVKALKNVSLHVSKGDYIAIMGPSGSGKTTLMNIIGCLDRADEGTYKLDGVDIHSCSENELSDIRLNKIGFVFQNFNLLAYETALDNAALPLIYAGISKEERNRMAMEELTEVGLQERASFLPGQLSGGQKQRTAIARAMVNHPSILLADEPTGALDQTSGKAVMDLFEKLNQEGVTIVMITHDAKVASRAKKILDIVDGEISEHHEEASHE